MKMIIVGSDKIFAIENYYVKYLRGLGVEVIHFPAQAMFYDYYRTSLFNKIIFKAGVSPIYKRINNSFKELVEGQKPDYIWVFKGMEIFPDSLRYAKSKNIKLVNFNPDNPFVFSGKGSGNKNVAESLALYDLHLTYDHEIQQQLKQLGLVVGYLPFGYDLSQENFDACQHESEIQRICFLGNPDKQRAEFMHVLAGGDLPLSLYGHGWTNFISHANIEIHNAVYGIEQWKTLRKYRVQLNLMRPHNPHSHNMRTFEVPAVGGIMAAVRTEDHRRFFADGQEAFLFSGRDECIALLKSLLLRSREQAAKVRIAARSRSLSSGYDYMSRTRQALSEIEII